MEWRRRVLRQRPEPTAPNAVPPIVARALVTLLHAGPMSSMAARAMWSQGRSRSPDQPANTNHSIPDHEKEHEGDALKRQRRLG